MKFNEFILKAFINSADVVTYEAEPNGFGIALYKVNECLLSILGHIIDFIKDNKFYAGVEKWFRDDKRVDLIANGINTSFIGGV